MASERPDPPDSLSPRDLGGGGFAENFLQQEGSRQRGVTYQAGVQARQKEPMSQARPPRMHMCKLGYPGKSLNLSGLFSYLKWGLLIVPPVICVS